MDEYSLAFALATAAQDVRRYTRPLAKVHDLEVLVYDLFKKVAEDEASESEVEMLMSLRETLKDLYISERMEHVN